MEEDYHIIPPFSSRPDLPSGDLAGALIESTRAPDEFPQAVYPDLILWTGGEFDDEYEQLSPPPYDGSSTERPCAPALLDFRSTDRPLHDGGPEMIETFDGKCNGGFGALAMSLQLHIESDETSPDFNHRSDQPMLDSAIPLSKLDSAARLPPDSSPQCKQCRRYFVSGYLLEDHAIRERHATFVCKMPGCEKSYRRRDSLRRHMATHRQAEITCPYCPKCDHRRIFQRKDNLSQHVRTRHPEHYHRYKSSVSGYSPPKQLLTIPETVDFISFADLDEKSERRLLPTQELSPNHSIIDTSMTKKSPCTTTAEIASALGEFLSDEDRIVVQIIQGHLNFGNQQNMEQLALSLARLALKEPQDIPSPAREQLQQTSAKCA